MMKYEEIKRLHIELSSMCNASCPCCPRNVDGGYTVPWMKLETMTYNDFVNIFQPDLLRNVNFILFCGNYGDPILCKDLPEIAKYVNSINPNTWMRVHTNGGVRSIDWWERFASSDHVEVVFSIDGLADTNHIYRRGVVWDKVIENAKAFISNGGKAIWEYLIFKHNEHQLDEAKALSEEIGFEKFRLKRPFGFEFYQYGFSSIRVIDKDGKFSYYIDEATDANHKNKVLSPDENLTRENFDLPIALYEKILENSTNTNHGPNFDFLNDTEIQCMAADNKEIYVDASGGVHPCCFIGHSSNNASSGPEAVQYLSWFNERYTSDSINAKKHTIKEIVNSEYFQSIVDSWNKTHSDGRIITCTKMCAKNKNIKDKLWV
jgi:MoaA/NifB/PqqE/SkfB family radical SAM enzyme